MTQVWTLDIFVHLHGRQIIQMPLIIHMLYFFGIQRVGAFLATADYPDLALRYKVGQIPFHVHAMRRTYENVGSGGTCRSAH
jgi:hypothetical protein